MNEGTKEWLKKKKRRDEGLKDDEGENEWTKEWTTVRRKNDDESSNHYFMNKLYEPKRIKGMIKQIIEWHIQNKQQTKIPLESVAM